MAKFVYNNAKNTSIGYILFKLNCDYHLRMMFEDKVDPHSRSCSVNKLAEKLRELIEICYQNLLYV